MRRWRRLVITGLCCFAGVLIIYSGFLVLQWASFTSRAAQLRSGMTRQEVLDLMGEPQRSIRLSDVEIALYTRVPFELHALFSRPGKTLSGDPQVKAMEFPACVEFENGIATRVYVEGNVMP